MSKKCVHPALLKKLFGLVLALSCACSVFLVSHEASALQRTVYPTEATIRWNTPTSSIYQTVNYRNSQPWLFYAPSNSDGVLVLTFTLMEEDQVTPFEVGADQYFTFSFSFSFRENNVFSHFASQCPVGQPAGTSTRIIVTDCNFSSSVVNNGEVYHYYTYFITARTNIAFSDGQFAFGWRAFEYIQSNNSNNQLSIDRPIFNFVDNLSESAAATKQQTEQQKQYHDEEQEGLDNAQSDASDGADSSGSQAESSGTTLLQAFIDFVNALNGASGSNCVINADIGDFRMGNVDLCSLSPPPAFQAISSIMVIGFTVPLSIALGKKMISLFRSFQT